MAHNVMIGGVVYEVDGGKDLIGGTVYEKDHGDTLAGGTAYEVSFAPPAVTIKVTGNSSGGYVRLWHNELYGSAGPYYSPTSFVANVGDIIYCQLIECWSSGFIYHNGDCVHSHYGEEDVTYPYTVVSDATINLNENLGSSKRNNVGTITITDTNE